MITLIPTSSAEHLAKLFTKKKEFRVIVPGKNKDGKRTFPDGEVYARIGEVAAIKGRVVVLASGQPHPNESVVELEIMLRILARSRASSLELCLSYFPYSMQDHAFEEGERNVAEDLVVKWTTYYGVKNIYTLDAHFSGKPWAGKYPISNISSLEALKEAARREYHDIVFLAPDKGGRARSGLPGFDKVRRNSHEVEMTCDARTASLIKGKTVGIVDDLLETGGTLIRCFALAKQCGAKRVVALVTHGVLPLGISRARKTFDKLYITNSIRRAGAQVDVSALIAHKLLVA